MPSDGRPSVTLDAYVIDVLMRDLIGHDHAPSAFIVYLWLWRASFGDGRDRIAISLQTMASETGLSKSSVQNALRLLKRRMLIDVTSDGPTAPGVYTVKTPWRRA
jgi:hypothetical protein